MDYEIKWFIENEVALLIQYNDLSIPQLIAMISDMNRLIEASPNKKVAVILDGSHMSRTKNNIAEVLKEFRNVRSEKWGFTVVVGAEGIIRLFAQLILQLARIEVRLAKNIDEAIEILYRVHPSLPRKSDG